jgi:CheY-like chemotaxis protein
MSIFVLIVDDDRSFRETASDLLRARGFVVAGEAADHLEALTAVERFRPDAVLLDIHLPQVDGFDIVSELSPGADGPRVLLTSSDAEAATEELARQCGAVGFVSKTELATADFGRYLSAGAPPGPS